jgi:hypothetical protein
MSEKSNATGQTSSPIKPATVKLVDLRDPKWAPSEPGAAAMWRHQWVAADHVSLLDGMCDRTFYTLKGVIPIFMNRDVYSSIQQQTIQVYPYVVEKGEFIRLEPADPSISAFIVDSVAALVTVKWKVTVMVTKKRAGEDTYQESEDIIKQEAVMVRIPSVVKSAFSYLDKTFMSSQPLADSDSDVVSMREAATEQIFGSAEKAERDTIRDLSIVSVAPAVIGDMHTGVCYPQVISIPKGARPFVSSTDSMTLGGVHFIVGKGGSGKTPLAWCLYWLAALYAVMFARRSDEGEAQIVNDGPPLYACVNEPVGHSDDVDAFCWCGLANGAHLRKARLFVSDSERREIPLPSAPLPTGVEKPATQRGGLNPIVLEAFIHRVSRAGEAVGMPTIIGMAPAADDDTFAMFLGALRAVAGEVSEIQGAPQPSDGRPESVGLRVSMTLLRTRHRSVGTRLPDFNISIGALLAASTGTSRMYHTIGSDADGLPAMNQVDEVLGPQGAKAESAPVKESNRDAAANRARRQGKSLL